jgi:translation elongation factor P/translation initiation factor 5A
MAQVNTIELKMRMLYKDTNNIVFMDDNNLNKSAPLPLIGDKAYWFMEKIIYSIVFYKDLLIDVVLPTFIG